MSVPSSEARARTGPPEKSLALTLVLGLDPIPGDALFYVGKPLQGAINSVVGGVSGTFFWIYVVEAARQPSGPSEPYAAMAAVMMGLIYIPTLVWDLVGGLTGRKVAVSEERRRVAGICEPPTDPSMAAIDGPLPTNRADRSRDLESVFRDASPNPSASPPKRYLGIPKLKLAMIDSVKWRLLLNRLELAEPYRIEG